MNSAGLSDLIFALGRRYPRLPFALLRALPLGLLHALRAPGLRETFRVAARAPWYRDAFAAAGVDSRCVRRPEDLGDFYLTPEVLKTRPEALLAGTPELAIESSGTTGHTTRVYLSRRELEYNGRQGGLLLGLYGLGAGDRLLCTLDLAWGLGALLMERGVRYTPLFAIVPGRVDPLEAYRRLAEYRFNVLVSDPFWLARLTAIARERGRPGPMKLLVGGGEGITERTRGELEAFWGAPLCMTYASTEAATILAFECSHQRGYHVNEFDFYVEIDRPDGDGYGEIVLTTVNRRVMPLVRYRTGDVARWMDGACPCGLPFRRLSPLRGRLDEQVSCAWGNVHPEFFEPLLRGVRGLAGDWQVALYERELTPVVQFRLELDGDGAAREAAVQAVLAALQQQAPEAWLAYCQRLLDVEFAFFAPGTLRQQRKLLRLVDERQSGPPAWVGRAIHGVRPR
ncbi:MAG: phenylacetate--CoA ligase family protein [candidate division NC10 bacterium]|nr:phenylacetate--CoA ligase family protein [candidate division NC10 bacterium]